MTKAVLMWIIILRETTNHRFRLSIKCCPNPTRAMVCSSDCAVLNNALVGGIVRARRVRQLHKQLSSTSLTQVGYSAAPIHGPVAAARWNVVRLLARQSGNPAHRRQGHASCRLAESWRGVANISFSSALNSYSTSTIVTSSRLS